MGQCTDMPIKRTLPASLTLRVHRVHHAPPKSAWMARHLDKVVLKVAGVKHWLWRTVDQTGVVLDVLVRSRRDKRSAKRLLRKLLKKQMRPPAS